MTGAWDWLTTGANWSGTSGVWNRLLEHLWYTASRWSSPW